MIWLWASGLIKALADLPLKDVPLPADGRRRMRVVSLVSVGMMVIGIPLVPNYFRIGLPWMALAMAMTIAAAAFNLILLRRTQNQLLAGVIGASIMLVIQLVDNWSTGGFYDPNFGWFYIVPLIAALLANEIVGWIFTGLTAVAVLGFWLLPELGVEVISLVPAADHATQSLINRISAALAIVVFVGAIASQQRFLARLVAETRTALRFEAERKENAEARLHRTERVASAGALMAGAAHEINNPLSYALGNVQLLLEAANGDMDLDEDPRQLAKEAHQGLTRVASLVKDLQRLPQVGTTRTATDVRDILDSALKQTADAVAKRARLTTRADDAVLMVDGANGRLVQVLVNLIGNAVQAIPAGAVDEQLIEVVATRERDHVEIAVMDSGEGIDSAVLDRVFEPFFTTKPIGKGTGLGLPISRTIVESVGGELTLSRRQGGGTTATVMLPLVDAPRAASGPLPLAVLAEIGRARPSGGRRVLFVDDEPTLLRLARRALPACDVSTTTRGAEAVEWCLNEPFDVVVCDVMMPNLTGMDVYEQVTAKRPEMADRFLFITGGVFASRPAQFVAAMGDRVVDKPLNFQELAARIDAIIDLGEGP